MAATLLLVFAEGAVAQNVDWLTNIDDDLSDPTPAGGTIDYTVSVTNNGVALAPPTTVDFSVPAGTTLTSATGGTLTNCTPVPAAGPTTVTCDVPALAQDEVASVVAQVLTTVAGNVTFGASVPIAGDDQILNNAVTEGTTVTNGADIELDITGPATAASGSFVTYFINLTNNGPDAATDIIVDFPIPTGLADIRPPFGCVLGPSEYTCTVAGPLALGASTSLIFSGQISAASSSTLTPVASVTDSQPIDPVAANDTDSINTNITAGSDVYIAKSRVPAGAVLTGDTVTFTLDAGYSGDVPTGLSISDTIPGNYSIASVTPSVGSGWICTDVGQDVDCTLGAGTVAGAGISLGSIDIVTTADTAGSATNTATITSTGPTDPVSGNNSATDGGATISDPVIDLNAEKTGPSPALVVVGQSYDFFLSASNDGNADFSGTLNLSDTPPVGMTIQSSIDNGFTCPATPFVGDGVTPFTCTIDYLPGAPLASMDSTPVVELDVLITAAGSLDNLLAVTQTGSPFGDGDGSNDTTTFNVEASIGADSADISVVKTATLATVAVGDVQTFVLEVVNDGPATSTNITLTDNFTPLINNSVGPTGAGYVGEVITTNAQAGGITCSSVTNGGRARTLTCDIASLMTCTQGSDCPLITVQVRPGRNGANRTNSATAISSDVADPTLTNNTGSVNYTTTSVADVTVSKVGTPDPATAGQNLTYVVTAQTVNTGMSNAENVTITDTLPNDMRFVSATPSNGSCSTTPTANTTTAPGNNTVTCNLGTINNGSQRTVTIIARPNTSTNGTMLTNDVSVVTSTVESDLTNNSDTLIIPVDAPVLDLLVNKTDDEDPLVVGEDTIYTVEVENVGPSAAENVIMTDLMPVTHLSYRSHVVPADGSCSVVPVVDSVGGTLTCEFPYIAAGESRSITITSRGVVKGVGSNSATVSSDETTAGFDTNTANNTDTEQTTVRTQADVEVVSKVASPDPTNLRDDFDFVIRVRNNTGAGLAEADDVSVSDSLPSGMELTGTPVAAVISGSASATTCTGSAGSTSFSCDLGTVSSGGIVDITVPVKVTTLTTNPQTFTNSASVTTSSRDAVPSNNTNSGDVVVNASSLAGVVFRDFDDDAGIDAGDTGVSGITMTLSGTAHDGSAVSIDVLTASDGTYIFPIVPAGTYTVSRGTVSEDYLTNGTNTAGTSGGTIASETSITSVALGADVDATDYLFPLIPQARIGAAKTVGSGPTVLPDGSFRVDFDLVVENFSLEDLNNVVVTDQLAGAAPGFGTYQLLAVPLTDPMVRGNYTVLSAPTGTCGNLNASFDGSGTTSVASGFTLAAGSSCTISISLRVNPTVPNPTVQPSGGQYENQTTVTGVGALSGQTLATNPQLSDLSDNGTDSDPDGNGQGNEAGENDPTPVSVPTYSPSIAIVKSSSTAGFSSPAAVGDVINYSFAITNTGDLTLTGITLTDILPGIVLAGGPIASLAPGVTDTGTFTASYTLTQPDIDAGSVTNQATTQGTDPFGNSVDDDSGSTVGDDTPTVTNISQTASIALVKAADISAFSSPPEVNDVITEICPKVGDGCHQAAV